LTILTDGSEKHEKYGAPAQWACPPKSVRSHRPTAPTTPLSFEAPAKWNPREYPHVPYISRN